MRHFLITFSIQGKNSIGSITLALEGFPSHSLIENSVTKEVGYAVKVVVHNFFEFKNEEDYNSYVEC